MCTPEAKTKEEYQKFVNTLSKEEYQKFMDAKSQGEFFGDELNKYLKFSNLYIAYRRLQIVKEAQNFLDTLSEEEYQRFRNAKSQEEFTDVKSREKFQNFLNARYQTLYNESDGIKSKEEFSRRFDKLLEYLEIKTNKSEAEQSLFERLFDINKYIKSNTPLPYQKEGYKQMLYYFEMAGGRKMMLQSDTGKEATDLLHYFVQNY